MCIREIKAITAKFTDLDVPTVFLSWTENGFITVNGNEEETQFHIGLIWDQSKKKIFYWFDDAEEKLVLAGENALIRSSVRKKLHTLVDKAVLYLNNLSEKLSESFEELDEDSLLGDPDVYEENSWQDRMMINGEMD